MSNDHSFTPEQIRDARYALWRKGNLLWKLDNTQREIYDFILNGKGKTFVINAGRRIGKSWLLTIIAAQQCIIKPRSIIKFLQPEQKMIRTNLRPIMEEIFADCPPELKPEFKTQDNIYRFPNGSEIQLAGTDSGNAEKIRGGNSDFCLIDEAAFVKSELEYLVRSILMPTTMLTRGKIILSSSSPKEENNDFGRYMEKAEKDGKLIRKDLFQALNENKNGPNPRITEEIVTELINEYPGGVNDPEFQRECMNIIPKNADLSVIPEFNDNIEKEICIDKWTRPAFYDAYTSMDIGFKDLTVVLFAYYDFDNAVTIIEDEIVMNGHQMTTKVLAEAIHLKEKHLWTDPLTNEFRAPNLRVSDNNLIVINDLQKLHGITFLPTQKDNKELQVNKVRMEIGGYQVYINKRCRTLINHLKYAQWDKQRNEFKRSSDNGHYDAVDALCYLIRNVDKNRNPYPKGFRRRQMGAPGDIFVNPYADLDNSEVAKGFRKMFKIRN